MKAEDVLEVYFMLRGKVLDYIKEKAKKVVFKEKYLYLRDFGKDLITFHVSLEYGKEKVYQYRGYEEELEKIGGLNILPLDILIDIAMRLGLKVRLPFKGGLVKDHIKNLHAYVGKK